MKEVRLGIIGCGLMGKELAAAAARWFHLPGLDFAPRLTAVCDVNQKAREWFAQNVPGLRTTTDDYRRLLEAEDVDAVYCAVPHHLHRRVYTDIIRAGKHLLGEKPFGIDLEANRAVLQVLREHPGVVARCSSEFPFFPGAHLIGVWLTEQRFGKLIEFEAGFHHSSDLNPNKPLNWKRQAQYNGEYGCLGDLGLHVLHLPLRFGLRPRNVRALLSNIVTERPDGKGGRVPCETWDNAVLACEAAGPDGESFPMLLSTKRIAPGEGNTWFLRVKGTRFSAEFSTKNPKEIRFLEYEPGGPQEWRSADLPHRSAYESNTGSIFEFGFSDSLLQMLAAFLDEVVNGENMRQPFRCATPEETAASHRLFTAALKSQRTGQTVTVEEGT